MASLASLEELFSADGLLADYFEGFVRRSEQEQMAQSIESAIKEEASICIEAGTGTGKTFAYLVPALKSWYEQDSKIIVSTGTKNLQDQLYFRDLPDICKALSISPKIALLKGAIIISANIGFSRVLKVDVSKAVPW